MTLPWTPTKGPKTKRLAEARLRQLLFHETYDGDTGFLHLARRHIPDAWRTLEMDVEVAEPKIKVTLYLDRSVARLFRAMGAGYQARINRILMTWLQLKIAEKSEVEQVMLARIAEARVESERETEGDDPDGRRRALHEHWAYNEGWSDAVAAMEAAGMDVQT